MNWKTDICARFGLVLGTGIAATLMQFFPQMGFTAKHPPLSFTLFLCAAFLTAEMAAWDLVVKPHLASRKRVK